MQRSKVLLYLLASLALAAPAYAAAPQEAEPAAGLGDMPEYTLRSSAETDVPLRLKPGKYQVVGLSAPVGKVVSDDAPAHVTGVVYDKESVALFPHALGASHVTVYDRQGKVLMARYVFVSDPAVKYLRLRQSCAEKDAKSCLPQTRVYYCPNLCYETQVMGQNGPLAAK